MKKLLLICLTSCLCFIYSVDSFAQSVVFTSLQGTSSTFTKGAGNTIPYGFSMFVPAGGSFSGGVLNIGITQSINGFANSATLVQVASADPNLANSAPITTYGMNINGSGTNALSISSWPNFTGAAGTGTTYYFYIIVNYNSSNNGGAPTAYQFYLPASGITQNPYSGGITVTNVNSGTFNFSSSKPIFTYTNQILTVGVPMTAVSPNNTGGTAASASSSPTLPAGLSISSDGTISGTPTTASAATNYTITLTNSTGTGTSVINITVLLFAISAPANNTYYNIGNNFTLTLAGTPNGTLRVDYSINGVALGSSSTSPFSLPVTATTGGSYPIIAKAYNATSGGTLLSTTAAQTVNVYPPAPTTTNGSRCGTGTVSIGASGTPTGGTFYLYAAATGGTAISNSTSTTFLTPSISSTTTYYVSYAVSGVESTSRTAVTATVNTLPAATFTATTPVAVNANATVTLTSTYSASNTYAWDFNGGTPSTGSGQGPFTVQWATAGTKTITLTVTTTATGCSTVTTQTVTVNPIAPVFTYSTPQTYTVGTAIATLSPTITGGPIGSYGSVSALGSGMTNAADVGIDASGNLYAFNNGGTNFYAFNSSGTAITNNYTTAVAGLGLTGTPFPNGVVFDGLGNMYFALYGSNLVYKITSAGVVSSAAITKPIGLAVDASNNVYVVNQTNARVEKIAANGTSGIGGVTTGVATGFTNPWGVAVSSAGDIYVSDINTNVIYKNNGSTVFASGFNQPRNMKFDALGSLTVADYGNNAIKKINSSGIVITAAATGNSSYFPFGVAYDAAGNLYVASAGNASFQKFTGTYFSIGTTLPVGLIFNTVKGTISGTPTTASATASYTVTGVNASGSGTFNISITVNNAALPAISYSTPQVYTVGTAISALSPTNTGGAVSGYTAGSTYKTITNSNGVATDASGNVYVVSSGGTNANSVFIYNSAGTLTFTQTGASYNYNNPAGIVVDAAGSTYVANRGNGTVVKTTTSNAITTLTGFTEPTGVALDASGNLYVVDRNSNTSYGGKVYKVATSTITGTTVAAGSAYISSGLDQPWGIAVNSAGDLFVSEPGPSNNVNAIFKYASGSTTQTTLVAANTSLSSPRNIVIDATTGNLIEADAGVNVVDRAINSINPITGAVSRLLATATDSPTALALDATGNLYYTGYNGGTIYKSVPAGYAISPALPAGLSFNTLTGVITGTPTATSAPVTYTVTATNGAGSGTATLSITVTTNTFATGYAYRDLVTLNTTNAAGTYSIATDQTNFPVLLKITDPGLVYSANSCTNKVQAPTGPTGYDFAFTLSSSATELNYQVESYDQTAGTLLVWVRVPSLTYANNPSLYFYYGNATSQAVTHNTSFTTATWNGATAAAKNYSGVWHFNEAPSTSAATILDATSAGNNLKAYTAGTVSQNTSSIIGNGVQTTGSNLSATVSGYSALNTSLTMSAWVYFATAPAGNQNLMVLINGSSADQLGFRSSANPALTNYGGGSIVASSTTASAATWHLVTYTYNSTGTVNSIYVDGVLKNTATATPQTGTPTNIFFGDYTNGSTETFTGNIDEARVIYTTLSSDWIKFEYANQSAPATFATIGSTSTDATNVLTIPGGVIYTTANGTTFTPNVTGVSATPSGNGKESYIITGSATLPTTASIYALTVNTGAALALSGQTMNVACNVVNNGTISYGTTASNINFNGSAAAQSYTAAATSNTASFGTFTVNNTAGGTITVSGGPIDVYNQLVITKGNLVINSSTTLTLKSTATLTASVPTIATGYTISGLVSAERYLQGSATDLTKRGYRLLSSPVYAATVSSNNVYDLNFLKTYSIVTGVGGATNGFTSAGNASIYLFREDILPNNLSFAAGNFKGIAKLNNTPSYNFGINAKNTLTNTNDATTYLPVGNGVLFFFRGNSTVSNGTTSGTKTTAPYNYPENTTLVQRGTLNTGTIPVAIWTTGTTNLNYTILTGNNIAPNNIRGYNLVGNPYPSAINWEKYNRSGASSSIYGSGSLPSTIYQYNAVTKQYASYQQKGTISSAADTTTSIRPGTSSDGVVSNIISSGEGFFIVANAPSQTLTFREAAKTSTQPASADLIKLMGLPVNTDRQPDAFIRLKLIKDSINTDAVAFVLNNTNDSRYSVNEDAVDLGGNGALTSMSVFSTDNVALSIDRIPLPKLSPQIAPLSVDGTTNGIYTLKIDELRDLPAIYSVWLMDAFKKDSLDMSVNKSYDFNIDRANAATFGNGRFKLVIRQNPDLAIKLLDFNGVKVTEGVKLNWVTENESNYTGFTVERSTDGGKTFEVIGGLQSNGNGKYSLIDKSPVTGLNQYRLKEDDLNGTLSYSKVVNLMYSNTAGNITVREFTVFPNPAVSMLNIAITSPDLNATTTYKITITSSNGTVVKTFSSTEPKWQGYVGNLLPGTYFVQVINNATKTSIGTTKFVKL